MSDKLLDPNYRLNYLYKIVDKKGRSRPFIQNDIQKSISANPLKRKMILKYRQGGVTTGEVIKQLDYVLFNPNKTACILAHEQDAIKRIFNIVKYAYQSVPGPFRPEIDRGGGSKHEMRFPGRNSKIFCDLEVRGATVHWLHISEAAFADPLRLKASLEAVPIDGIVTYESTPNGMGNDFYRTWNNPSTRIAKLFYPWFTHKEYRLPIYDPVIKTTDEIEFVKKTKEKYGVDIDDRQIMFRRAKMEDLKELYWQEYPEDDATCFLASGNAAMDLFLIKRLLESLSRPLHKDDNLEIYEEKNRSHTYVIGADVAEGVNSDYSVAQVWDATTKTQVAELRSKSMKPRQFAHAINDLAKRYYSGRFWPLVGVEVNNHGHAVLQELNEHIHYPNLYFYGDDRIGWKTDSMTRPLMIDTFIDAVENSTVQVKSHATLSECLTLIDNEGKIEASEGEHDDCIIAAAIALQMCIVSSTNQIYDNLSSKIFMG